MKSSVHSKLVPAGECADRLGIPITWLVREARAGRIPSVCAGRRRLFDPDDVLSALKMQKSSKEVKRGH